MLLSRPLSCWVIALLVAAALAGVTVFAQGGANAGAAPAGVYTSTQAERGKDLFVNNCGNCHGVDFKGAFERAPALTGDAFLKNWEGRNVSNLFAKIKQDMPKNNRAGTLTDAINLDIVAAILQVNAYPAGAKELNLAALEAVPLSAGGVATKMIVPNFAVVETVGCLARDSGNRWALKNASEPVTSKDQPLTSQEESDAAVKPLGSGSFELISVSAFKPELNDGHKIAARGLLYRTSSASRLDVTSFQRVADNCTH